MKLQQLPILIVITCLSAANLAYLNASELEMDCDGCEASAWTTQRILAAVPSGEESTPDHRQRSRRPMAARIG